MTNRFLLPYLTGLFLVFLITGPWILRYLGGY